MEKDGKMASPMITRMKLKSNDYIFWITTGVTIGVARGGKHLCIMQNEDLVKFVFDPTGCIYTLSCLK